MYLGEATDESKFVARPNDYTKGKYIEFRDGAFYDQDGVLAVLTLPDYLAKNWQPVTEIRLHGTITNVTANKVSVDFGPQTGKIPLTAKISVTYRVV
jgi:hypothetical protein